jgi:hypothetical protein
MHDEQRSDEQIRQRLGASYALFAPIRRHFDGPGVERGGHERAGVTPIWTRKFGAYADVLLADVQRYSVEASFDANQLAEVNTTIVALKRCVEGLDDVPPFAERVVAAYRSQHAPAFGLALMEATEALLRDFVGTHPEQVCTLDAIMRVAGGEGLRDLVRFYGARLLAQTLAGADTSSPDLLAFVDVHDAYRRDERGASVKAKYEVWCPGYDLSKIFLAQCRSAAQVLAAQPSTSAPSSLDHELQLLPADLSGHFNRFVQTLTQPILERYGVA